MRGGFILFIVEGTSDKDTIVPYITEQVMVNRIQTTVKVVGGDITTKWVNEYTKDTFECTSANIRLKLQNLINDFFKSGEAKKIM